MRILIPALGLGAYALLMFTASGFFLTNYRDVMASCGRFSISDCTANDAFIVSSISLRIGAIVFFLMGSFAWAIASYLVIKLAKHRYASPLP